MCARVQMDSSASISKQIGSGYSVNMIITKGHAKEQGGDRGGKEARDHGDAAEFALPRILVIDEPEPTTPQRKE